MHWTFVLKYFQMKRILNKNWWFTVLKPIVADTWYFWWKFQIIFSYFDKIFGKVFNLFGALLLSLCTSQAQEILTIFLQNTDFDFKCVLFFFILKSHRSLNTIFWAIQQKNCRSFHMVDILSNWNMVSSSYEDDCRFIRYHCIRFSFISSYIVYVYVKRINTKSVNNSLTMPFPMKLLLVLAVFHCENFQHEHTIPWLYT